MEINKLNQVNTNTSSSRPVENREEERKDTSIFSQAKGTCPKNQPTGTCNGGTGSFGGDYDGD